MRVKVLDPEVGFRLIFIRPWAAHEHLFAGQGLLHVCRELFQQVHEAANDTGVLRCHGDLLSLHHLFEQSVEQVLPVWLAQCGRHDVDLLKASLLERSLVVEHLCLELHALAVDVQEPQWWVAGVLGQAGYLSRIRGVSSDAELARTAETGVAKTVERRVLAFVLIILFARLFDDDLDLIVR